MQNPLATTIALFLNAEAFMSNKTFQTVEPDKSKFFYNNNSCALLGAGAYI